MSACAKLINVAAHGVRSVDNREMTRQMLEHPAQAVKVRITSKPEIIALSARLSGSESRVSTFDVHVANIIRACETRGHNSIHASISNGLAIVLIDMSKDPQVDPSDRRLLAEEIRGSVEFGSC